jgi:quinol monooxygenase YgiN
MIITIRFTIIQNKFAEFCLTLQALQDQWNKKKGFMKSYFYRDIENDNIFCLMQEWKTREDIGVYVSSKDFDVLIGAIRLLTQSVRFKISSPLSVKETEKILGFQQKYNEILSKEVVKQ